MIDVPNQELEGCPLEGGVPGLITDLVLSLDDRDLFLSNWLHGDLRHYDVSDPSQPVLRSQAFLGGLLGRDGGHPKAGGPLNGGPQMLQNSLDGDRVYVTNSLFSTWDNQFYPEIKGWLTKLDRQSDGSYALDPDFFVDFHEQTEGGGPTRSISRAETAPPRSSNRRGGVARLRDHAHRRPSAAAETQKDLLGPRDRDLLIQANI